MLPDKKDLRREHRPMSTARIATSACLPSSFSMLTVGQVAAGQGSGRGKGKGP